MKEIYCSPHCNQTSTRRWNLKTHINRRHAGAGRPIPKIATDPMWTGEVGYQTRNNNFSITNHNPKAHDPGDFLEQILQQLRKVKEFKDLYSELSGQKAPGLNMGFMVSDLASKTATTYGTTLGYKGYGCDKCLTFGFEQIFDHPRTSLKVNHICNTQRLSEAQFVRDKATILKQRRQELVLQLTMIVDYIFQQEPIELSAVEIPYYVFEKPNSEEYVDLDSLSSSTAIDWAYDVARGYKIKIDNIVLSRFLAIFNATLGFFRLKIDGTNRYFFTYIAKGLQPWDIEYLKNLDKSADANHDSNIAWNDMVQFVDTPCTNGPIPMLRLDKFRATISNRTGSNISNHDSNIAWNDMVQFVDTPCTNGPIPMLRLDIFRAS
ncbi:MAG TPA: hypothetical protein VFI73_09070 [Candidatus Nitrosopolaris sp.]|nr:hypothetical protein [Candidatus Nitrosopolaris sp.]